MKTEDIFDIVDANDQVIGSAPRSEVHAKGLKHRAVHMLVYNANGELLIQLRSAEKDRHPNTWDSSAAGHVDSGETYEIAANRELREELGISVPELKEIGYLRACEETGQEFVRVYETHHEGPFLPQASEIAEVRWISIPELEHWMAEKPGEFAPALPYLWKQLKY
jgi:16S rRNA (adenine1518-N6/adenine1519-N6)-dimethyltransferase